MRISSALLATVLMLVLAAPTRGLAQSGPPPQAPAPPSSAAPTPESSDNAALDRLFERLAASQDEDETKGITRLIERRWLQSGSDTADLLMSRAITAAAMDKDELAVELLDRVLALEPNWAEAWNKRALIFTSLGDEQQAILDLRQAVAREPRHYVAWTGLGVLFREVGDKKAALAAYERALAIAPHLPDVEKAVEQLKIEVNGRDI
jgi:tetratricopeptide (TPR) repeat protein